jgi:hypothetical protein
MFRSSTALGRLAGVGLLIALIGCVPREPTDTEEALRARVSHYWDLKAQRDVVKMYDLLEKAYRERTSLADWIGSVNRDMKYFQYRIDSVERDGDHAVVRVSYTMQLPDYVLMGLAPLPKLYERVPETWKLEGGAWYRVFDSPASISGRPAGRASRGSPTDKPEGDPEK